MISVVIPLYNKAVSIAHTIESVLAQKFQEFEIIVVNDGSTDGSAEVVEKINDSRIRVIYQENAGVSAARNRGIEAAKYEWVALLDGDDRWKGNYLQTLWNLHLKYPECDVCACNYEICDHMGRVTLTKINKLPFSGKDGILTNYFEVASSSNPPLCASAIMAKRNAFLDIGGFPVGIKSGEDLLTWARLAVKFKIAYSRMLLSIYNDPLIGEKPKREITDIDLVGDGLLDLYNKYKLKDLAIYLSHWHKMRSYIFMISNKRKSAFKESYKSLTFNRLNIKVYIYQILLLLPYNIRLQIIKKLRS